MKRIQTLYLAGPDHTFEDAAEFAARKRAMCEVAGFTGVTPLDGELIESDPSEAMARELYAARMELLRRADAVIGNFTPWRGPGADPAVAFEAGVASGLGKPVFAYMNVVEEPHAEHRQRILEWIGGRLGKDGVWRDAKGAEIEDFGLPESLMLWSEARRLYVIVTDDPLTDLTGLELCLQAVRMYAE